MNLQKSPIQTVREQRGMTQEETAAALNIDCTVYCDYEACIQEPDIFLLLRLAEIFHVDIVVLLPSERKSLLFMK